MKEIFIQGKNTRIKCINNSKYGKIKFIKLKRFMFTCCIISIYCWEWTRIFPSPFHVSTSSGLTLAGAFRGDYVAACSTAFRSASEENDSGGYVDVPCPCKMKQRSSTADWLKFQWSHQISYDGTHAEQNITFKVKLCTNSQTVENLLKLWI